MILRYTMHCSPGSDPVDNKIVKNLFSGGW